ncbi:hypothetical protein ABZ639_06405 [Saccharomonospora sp. NPDC006951]
MGRHSRVDEVEEPEPDPRDALTSTGSHRAVGKAARRKVAAWPIACLVLVGLLVAGWFGWNWADGMLSNRAEAQAAECGEGDTSIRVLTAPAVTKPVSSVARQWNEARTVVHGHCVRIDVQAVRSDRVLDELLGEAGQSYVDDTTAAWLPESITVAEKLSSERPELIGSQPESIAEGPSGDYPYVALAGNGVDSVKQRAAQSFRAYLLDPANRGAFDTAGFGTPARP